MNHFAYVLIAISFIFTPSPSYSFDFFEPFKNAKKGDYFIVSINKTSTCLNIFEKNKDRIVIEEMTYLQSKLKPQEARAHFENLNQPSSHTFLEIDIANKECLFCYDALHHAFLDPSQFQPLLLTLFSLDFRPLKPDERRKIGVLDIGATVDHRPFWNPHYFFESKIIKGRVCDGFRAIIPEEIKWIGGKYIEIYQDPQLKEFCFPVWMQVSDEAAAFKLLPMDMGKNFRSQKTSIPRPIPYFASCMQFDAPKASFEFETTYPLAEHHFFLYDYTLSTVIPLAVKKTDKLSPTRHKITVEAPTTSQGEFGIYSTVDSYKDLIIESIETFKFPSQ